MLFARAIQSAMDRCRAKPVAVRLLAAAGLTGAVAAVRLLADPVWPAGYPFLLSFFGIVLSAALFKGSAGVLSTAMAAGFGAFFYLEPVYSFRVGGWPHIWALVVFVVCGAFVSTVIEALHDTLDRLRTAERARALLLQEFRHRSRNDLQSLSALLLLRARAAPPEAQEVLQEAAAHARSLARVHTQLGRAEPGINGAEAVVDAADFIRGLVAAIDQGAAGDGLRPVALVVTEAQRYPLSTERAVQVGLVLNEAVTNALKYAFPEDRGGTVCVSLRVEGDQFVLRVEDDGAGLPPGACVPPQGPPSNRAPGTGLGTRLLRSLAAQLRGSFTRQPRPDGTGCVAELVFPLAGPPTAPPIA